MIKKEWLSIFKNPMMIVVLVCIALIPAIYAGVYLSSMWNTYGHEENIPVAVVNRDQAVNFNGKMINMGKTVSTGLKKSRSLNYKFTNLKKAERGLKIGKYYLILKIPKNFSQRLTTLLTDNPQQLKLTYETNRGLSFFASQISKGTMTAVKSEISAKITEDYLQQIMTNFKAAGNGMLTAAKANSRLVNASQALQNSSDSIKNNKALLTQISRSNAKIATDLKTSGSKINAIPTDKKVYAALSQPIKLVHHDISKTKVNGVGMAPFAICIGLYVGCISISFMYDMYTPKKYVKSATSWWLSKASVLLILSMIQAGMAVFAVISILGLQPYMFFQTILMIFVISLAFISCVFALNVLLGAFGKYLVTILLILQLGGSGGVYPIETANTFTKLTNPFLPMTYGIHSLKESISIGNGIGPDLLILAGLIIILNLLVVLKLWTDKKRGRFGKIEMDNN